MTLLHADGIGYEISGARLLAGISLRLEAGELVGLIGPNGSGKSTMLRLLAGLRPPSEGQIWLTDRPLARLDPSLRGRLIAYLPQNPVAHWPLSVERLVELGRLPHLGLGESAAEAGLRVIDRVLAATDCLHLSRRRVDTLSGGEFARVMLARALASEPRLLLADEPIAALDPAHQLEIMALLRRHCTPNNSALVVLHDLRFAAHYCDRLLLLKQGAVVACGPPEEVVTPENLERVYGIRLREPGLPIAEQFAVNWVRATG